MEFWRLKYSHVVDNDGMKDEVEEFFKTLEEAMSYIVALNRCLELTDICFDKCYMSICKEKYVLNDNKTERNYEDA